MNYLLDTHSLIWYAGGDTRMSLKARSIVGNEFNTIFISVISFFEMAIKFNVGKLVTPLSLSDFFKIANENEILILPITQNYLIQYISLPLFAEHRDPFDKLIIATAMEEHLTIITTDKKFILYNELVDIIW